MRLIDADALKEKLCYEDYGCTADGEEVTYRYVMEYDIDNAPTIEAEPVRRGRWIQKSKPADFCTYWWYECSACGDKPPNDRYGHPNYLSPYCPTCGARMEEQE